MIIGTFIIILHGWSIVMNGNIGEQVANGSNLSSSQINKLVCQ